MDTIRTLLESQLLFTAAARGVIGAGLASLALLPLFGVKLTLRSVSEFAGKAHLSSEIRMT